MVKGEYWETESEMTALQNDDLPVSGVLPELAAALKRHGRAVLAAPPGAGKTTLVPPYLLQTLCGSGGRIVLLEPRRVAARAAAARIAALLGDRVGGVAGYRVRGESRVSEATRIEVVTDGVLIRMVQDDPELSGISLVVFDEFHERHLEGDLALALVWDVRGGLREDLRVLVMSATLEVARIAALLDDAPVVEAAGRVFPVVEHWGGPFGTPAELPRRMAVAVRRVAEREPGGVLAFLPGVGEIEKTAALLRDALPEETLLVPLHGSLDRHGQDAALAPAPPGRRKVVLATNIAESSLTLDGVRVVIDSGYERRLRFDPASGMPRLECCRISRASAAQRAGRAGRTEAGAVYRLWTEADHRLLPERPLPEIREADLSRLALELARWGAPPEALRWLDPPPEAAWSAARRLLRELGALDVSGKLTPRGRSLAVLPVHPRLGAMLLQAGAMDLIPLGCELAALLEERDILPPGAGADVSLRLEQWRRRPREYRALNGIRDQLLRLMRTPWREQPADAAGLLLAHAYPEWIGRSRAHAGTSYLLRCGRGAALENGDDLRRAGFLAVARLDGGASAGRIRLAAALREEDLRRYFPEGLTVETVVEFDREHERVSASREERFGAIVLRRTPLEAPPPEQCARLLAEAIRETGLQVPTSDGAARSLLERVRFAASREPGMWPDWSEAGVAAQLETWLLMLPQVRSFDALRKVDWHALLRTVLGHAGLERLERIYPEKYVVPTGSRIRIDYSGPVPVLAVRVQELYGLKTHPALGGGHVSLKLELLSPARRVIQITSDLPGFWRNNWAPVRREMRAAYPKHFWPENPAEAQPTTRAGSSGGH